MKPIESLSVKEFLEKLSEDSFPSPAAGSAAATMVGMAASLLEMSYKVTMKNSTEQLSIDLEQVERVRYECLELATKDMGTLEGIIQAGKVKEELPDQYEAAVKAATDTLIAIVKNSRWIIKQIEQLTPVCDKKVYAELIGSKEIAEAAQSIAKLGVKANVVLLKDKIYKENIFNQILKPSPSDE